MVAHGFLAALSFGLSGYLYHYTRTLDMSQLGGLLHRLPFIGTALIMAMLAGCGLPGFANFVGEIMVFFGSWTVFPWQTSCTDRCPRAGASWLTRRTRGASCRLSCCSDASFSLGEFLRS
jgi:NADH:ubiquinone oxidoreductase subunit 5 (subunit L)/multisubunit Na+/H+ antiporter MnhA subunit